MSSNRREFIEKLGATAMLGALPLSSLGPALGEAGTAFPSSASQAAWDFRWVDALKNKKHKAVVDCTEVESGLGVWRASFWANQYQEVLRARPEDIGNVLVLRHNAILLAFQQPLWDAANIGPNDKITHPLTQQGTTRNPALLSSARNEVPANLDAFALPNFIQRGGIVLACQLALDFHANAMAPRLGVTPAEARTRALASLVPGVTMMPSGVFACIRAGEEGCHYVKGS